MTDEDVLEAMNRYGGSFVQALADCFRFADDINRLVLKAAFSGYWAEYTAIAEERAKAVR